MRRVTLHFMGALRTFYGALACIVSWYVFMEGQAILEACESAVIYLSFLWEARIFPRHVSVHYV